MPTAVAETAPVAPEERCTVDGNVFNSQSGEPLRKVSLLLRRSDLRQGGGPGSVYSGSTDAAGHFLIAGIEPGKYRLSAERTGFVNQQYGAARPGRAGTEITLEKSQKLRDMNIRLIPHGVIAGKVLDEDGDPMANSQIQVLRSAYVRGRKQLVPVESAQTNDLGDYRVFGLSPGRYYLSATHRRGGGFRGDGPAQGAEQEAYTATYYPSANNPDMAAPLEVTPGAQMQGVDFRLQKTRTVRVSGRLLGPTPNGVRGANIMLTPRGQPMNFGARNSARPYNTNGDFMFPSVAPGSYTLVATQMLETGKAATARMALEVGGSPIEGLAVQLTPAAQLTGKVRVEGTGGEAKNLRVSLTPKTPGMNMGPGAQGGATKEDGTFTLANVQTDAYDVRVGGVPDGGYVKSIRLGNADVTESGLDFTAGVTPAELTVVVSMTAATVEGMVQNDKQEPATGVVVVLVPEGPRRELDRYYVTTNTDATGHFTLKNVSPGEYRVYSFDYIEGSPYMDPDWLKPFESNGERVSAKESGKETVQVKLSLNQ